MKWIKQIEYKNLILTKQLVPKTELHSSTCTTESHFIENLTDNKTITHFDEAKDEKSPQSAFVCCCDGCCCCWANGFGCCCCCVDRAWGTPPRGGGTSFGVFPPGGGGKKPIFPDQEKFLF